jgi:hypothetical protein
MTAANTGGTSQAGTTQKLSEPQHQSLKDLYAYWISKKGIRRAPPRSAIIPAEIVPLLPTLALIDVIGSPPRFCFRLFGTGLVEAYGQDLTGKFLDEIDLDSINVPILHQAAKVARECCVHMDRDCFTKRDGRHLEYERIALPLSEDGSNVNMILFGHFVEKAYGGLRAPLT